MFHGFEPTFYAGKSRQYSLVLIRVFGASIYVFPVRNIKTAPLSIPNIFTSIPSGDVNRLVLMTAKREFLQLLWRDRLWRLVSVMTRRLKNDVQQRSVTRAAIICSKQIRSWSKFAPS